MALQRRRDRVRLGGVAFSLAVASSALIGVTFLASMIGSLLGAPPQQAWFTVGIGVGIAAGVLCALAGVAMAHASRHHHGAAGRTGRVQVVAYCILGSLAVLVVFGTVTLIALAHD